MLQSNSVLRRLLYLLLATAATAAFCRFLLPPLLPLLLAFVLSGLLCRPVDVLCKKLPLSRGLCALLALVVMAAFTLGFLWILWQMAEPWLSTLPAQLPKLIQQLQDSLSRLQIKLVSLFPTLRQFPQFSPSRTSEAIPLPALDLQAITGPLGRAASSLPDILLTTVFVIAATVFLTGQRTEILSFVKRQLPPKMAAILSRLRQDVGGLLLGWCKAQGILSAVTFALLSAGLLLLRVQNPLLLAVVIALADTLPIIGAGLFLLPWALGELLLGGTGRAAGLALLYAVTVAVRNLLEPHVLGRQIGLHPFVSLVSVYYGWRLAGFAGMLLAPCFVLILVKLQEWGYSKLWR